MEKYISLYFASKKKWPLVFLCSMKSIPERCDLSGFHLKAD